MSLNQVGSIQVALSATHSALVKGFAEAAKSVDDFKNHVASAGNQIKGAVGAWLSVQGAKQAAEFVKNGMDSVAMLQRQSEQLGIATDRLAGMRLAAEQNGMEQEQFAVSMAKLQQVMAGANVENEDAVKTFRTIGISVAELRGKNADQAFGLIADRISAMGSASDRTAAVMKIFGDQGRALLPIIEQGSAGINRATDEAGKLGLAFSGVDTQKVVEAQRALNEAGSVVSEVGQRFAVELAPYITAAADAFISAAKESGGFRDTITSVVETAVKGAVWVYDGWLRLGEVWQALRVGVTWITKQIIDLAVAAVGVAQRIGAVFSTAWDMVKTAAGAAWAWMKSAFADFAAFINDKWASVLDSIGAGLNKIRSGLGDGLRESAANARANAQAFASGARDEFNTAANEAKQAAGRFVDALADGFKPMDLAQVNAGALSEWSQNVTDNLEWEKNQLAQQDADRIAMVQRAEKAIATIKQQATQRAEVQAKASADRIAATTANSAAVEAERLRNRMAKLDSADNDPRVKHEKEVLQLVSDTKTHYALKDAEAEVTRREQRRAEMIAESDPQVAYEMAVSDKIAEIKRQRAQAEKERLQQEQQMQLQAASEIAGNLETITSTMAAENDKWFAADKAVKIAQAVINAWMAYSNTLASPLVAVNPMLANALAASQLAAGFMAVNNIANQQPPGRANGGFVGAGGMFEVAERGPEMLSVGDKTFLMMGNKDGRVQPGGPGAGGTSVTVHNYAPGYAARVESGGTPSAPSIDVIIERVDQAQAAGLRSGQSATARAMVTTFGLNRARGGR